MTISLLLKFLNLSGWFAQNPWGRPWPEVGCSTVHSRNILCDSSKLGWIIADINVAFSIHWLIWRISLSLMGIAFRWFFLEHNVQLATRFPEHFFTFYYLQYGNFSPWFQINQSAVTIHHQPFTHGILLLLLSNEYMMGFPHHVESVQGILWPTVSCRAIVVKVLPVNYERFNKI